MLKFIDVKTPSLDTGSHVDGFMFNQEMNLTKKTFNSLQDQLRNHLHCLTYQKMNSKPGINAAIELRTAGFPLVSDGFVDSC